MSRRPLNPLTCAGCDYDLRGLRAEVCPECGQALFRFTDQMREVARLAQQHAIELLAHRLPDQRHPPLPWLASAPQLFVWPRSVLAVMARGPLGTGSQALLHCGADPLKLARDVDRACPMRRRSNVIEGTRLPMAFLYEVLIGDAVRIARDLGHEWVGTGHLLLALTRTDDVIARRAIARAGVRPEAVRLFVAANGKHMGRDELVMA